MVGALFGGIAVECALAADRNYKIENCDRKKLWEDFSIHLQTHKPELIEFLDKNVNPTKEGPKLSESDFKDVEQFDKKIQWHISECILIMKEINQLSLSAYTIDPDKSWIITFYFEDILVQNKIPFIEKWTKKENRKLFSINFAPLRPEKTF